jgi:membrane protease YdiL (CAAX protease family)
MAALAAIVVCSVVYLYSMLIDEGKYWVQESLNRAGWIVAFDRDMQALPARREGRVHGLSYEVACGPAERLGEDAQDLMLLLRSRKDAMRSVGTNMCRIEFEVSQRAAMREGALDRVSVDDVLAQVGVRGGRPGYSTSYRFLGSNTLAGRLVEVTEILLMLLLFGSVAAFRRDLASALDTLKTRMYLIYLPKVGSMIAGVLATLIEKLFARIPPDVFFRSIETMSVSSASGNSLFSTLVHAPIVEELMFRYALFTVLTRWWTPLAAAVMASAMFSASHLQLYDTTRTISLFVSGMLMQWLYVRYRSVIFCMLAHATTNGIIEIAHAIKDSG